MSLKIKTFSNVNGGSSAFKAMSHPLAAPKAAALLERLAAQGPIAIYDPLGLAADFDALYALSDMPVTGVFVQNLADIGKQFLGHEAQPVNNLPRCAAKTVFIVAFDTSWILQQIRHLLPAGAQVITLDELRLPDEFLTNTRNYLDKLNFATNFALFRDAEGHHTRIVTANYWSGYGAKNTALWFCLFDEGGKVLAQWREPLSTGTHLISVDSQDIRKRFNLGEFTGSLFIHATGVAGHDIVKYALDIYGDDEKVLSCTHDANAWPADFYAGLPAPQKNEKVILWIQNSHSCPIPANSVGLNLMGSGNITYLKKAIAPFATYALDVSSLMPGAAWPQQLEVQAGRYFVRPRYEILSQNGRRRIAHANVERTDLKPDPNIPGLSNMMGKGYLLPAPILPPDRWRSIIQPTPMATGQQDLPVALIVYDSTGTEILRHPLGLLARKDSIALDVADLVHQSGHASLKGGFGHMELVYDFSKGGSADGWLHALFRYEEKTSGQSAETSFGAHIFNTPMVYKDEPQSYSGRPPGLSTRLFLRVGQADVDTLCHLIYPASTPWHAHSETDLILFDKNGTELLKKRVSIACSGSLLWRYHDMFSAEERKRAGDNAYVMIRDTTCRLFGYHGLIRDGKAFCLDHMFGF